MLVLSRKFQEAIVVGDSLCFERMVKVTVLEIRHGKVKLGFEAHDDVPVHRWEVWERMRAGVLVALDAERCLTDREVSKGDVKCP
jgi:carbon storage regulator